MKRAPSSSWALALGFSLTCLLAGSSDAGTIHSITYHDLPLETLTDLTTAGTLDWVKWGDESAGGPTFTAPEKVGGAIINPALTPLGTVPAGQTIVLLQFLPPSPTETILDFSWTDGTEPMVGGGPVSSVVSEAIDPPQTSYPLGLGVSFQAAAGAEPLRLDVYVQGFNTRMRIGASLSGGGSASLLASDAALHEILVPTSTRNYVSAGYFSITYSGAGETLTINLIADNQIGIPTNATQYGFRNAGVFAATVNPGTVNAVPEPSSLIAGLVGVGGLLGLRPWRRRNG